MGRQVADVNTREATELKMMAGSETETAGVTGKLKETAGSEAEMVVGMESGVDSKSTVDQSGVVAGAEVSTKCEIVTAGADMRSPVAGTTTKVDAAPVARLQVGPVAETIPLACTAVSELVMGVNVGLGISGAEMEQVA